MSFESVATLRKLLANMEHDLGLGGLSEAQRDLLYAAQLLDLEDGSITVMRLQAHELAQGLSRATFYRALRSLVDKGYLRQDNNRLNGYVVAGGE